MDNKHLNELKAAAMPLIEYMRKHYNPHNKIIVTLDRIEVLSGEMSVPVEVRSCVYQLNKQRL